MSKPKVIKQYSKLDDAMKVEINNAFPRGFDKYLITFKDHKGKLISALPYESEEFYYFIKMTREQAHAIYQGLGEYAKPETPVEVEEKDEFEEIEELTDAPEELSKEMDN